MAQMKTPGVYIVEKDAFGNGVVEVATAVPAFIGYTERAESGGKSLLNKPTRITSIGEYNQFFGGAPKYQFELSEAKKSDEAGENEESEENAENTETAEAKSGSSEPDVKVRKSDKDGVHEKGYNISPSGQQYRLYNAMRLFFQNGGGPCYIVSVGSYTDDIENAKLMDKGIPPLLKEEEPTMVVVPEAINLKAPDCYSLQQAILAHCNKMQSRIGILDIYDGYKERNPTEDVINNFRDGIGANSLMYGTAYYPWIHTTIVGDSELGLENFTKESLNTLQSLIMFEQGISDKVDGDESLKTKELRTLLSFIPGVYKDDKKPGEPEANAEENETTEENESGEENKEAPKAPPVEDLNKILIAISPAFNDILMEIKSQLNLMSPSSAMAGIYTFVDNNRGVWKAPANVSLNSVVRPAVNISHDEQEDLNVTLHGKSINAIRPFIGEGTLVWGARTLDGNSKDWRYVNVRRTMIMLEQSIKAAAKAYVFEPNDSNTWTTMKSMIDSFLFNQWKKGALVGASPEDAYSVSVGLGSTMTADDILEGILRITVLVAISRPAEFIEITFQQQMQKS